MKDQLRKEIIRLKSIAENEMTDVGYFIQENLKLYETLLSKLPTKEEIEALESVHRSYIAAEQINCLSVYDKGTKSNLESLLSKLNGK